VKADALLRVSLYVCVLECVCETPSGAFSSASCFIKGPWLTALSLGPFHTPTLNRRGQWPQHCPLFSLPLFSPPSLYLPLCVDLIILQGDAALRQMHGCKLGEGWWRSAKGVCGKILDRNRNPKSLQRSVYDNKILCTNKRLHKFSVNLNHGLNHLHNTKALNSIVDVQEIKTASC